MEEMDLYSSNDAHLLAQSQTLYRVIGEGAHKRQLNLIFLGCEPKPPYGPNDHTAELLLDLISQAIARQCSENNDMWTVSLQIFDVQKGRYPSQEEWAGSQGVILPGSFASAYNTDPWIERLKQEVQTQIVAARRPCLGICFGHQILAHSYADGFVAPNVGFAKRAGRVRMQTTPAGQRLLGQSAVDLYVTHGDMVQQLPSSAVCLGGYDQVPIASAAYFASAEEASEFMQQPNLSARPFAVTFQAHPEYASSRDLGMYRTFGLVLDAMKGQDRSKIEQDAHSHFDHVQNDSVEVMAATGRLLGWF
jgi:GMP synthase-like glutamine amidotransferase